MKGVMKEVVVEEPHKTEVREVPVPELSGEDEALIQMESAGVCGSGHHIYYGLSPCSTYPRTSGYESVGVVVKAGSAITNVKMGDHVVIGLTSTRGICYQCRIGRRNVCEHTRVRGSGTDGDWREYSMAPASEVYKVDDPVDWKDAALAKPHAISAHRTDRVRTVPEDMVLVLGADTIGSIILQVCKAKGRQMVICCDIDGVSLQRAKECGADHVTSSKMEDVVKRVAKVIHNHGVTAAFDSACLPGSLTICTQPGIFCNVRRMVPPGFSTAKEEITQTIISQRELDVAGSRMFRFQFEPTIQRMENGELNTKGIAAMFIPFSEVDKVFYHMDRPCTESGKMVILFD